MRKQVCSLLAAATVFISRDASAHVMPAHQGTLAVHGRQAYLAIALPATLLREADDDGDGRLSVAEVAAHQDLLQRLVATRVHLGDASHDARLLYAQVVVERLDDDRGATPRPASNVLVLVVGAFDAEPSVLRLRVDRLTDSITVRASHPDIAGDRAEAQTLDAAHDSVTFFAPPSLLAGLRSEHLIIGTLVVLAIAGWRRRLWSLCAPRQHATNVV